MLDQYDAFIFDLDGTLVDSGKLHEVAWTRTLQKYDIPIDRALMRSLAGVPTMATITMLLERLDCRSPAPLTTMNEFKEALVRDLAKDYVRPTALHRIAIEHQDRVPMCVGTGAYTDEAQRILEICGLTHLIGHVVGADRVDRPKPAPDTFLLCAQLMGVAPQRCVVFEDSSLGLEAAERADMASIDVLQEYNIVNDYFL